MNQMTPEMKVQIKGFTVVGLMLAAAGVILAVWFVDMSDNSLMAASLKYKPVIPAIKATDITQAPQCAEGYDKNWIGCQRLGQ